MPDESSEVTARLPPEAADWIAARAEESELSADELLARLVAAHRAVEGDGVALPGRVDDLEGDVEELRTALDEQIGDVRERVVQVKREADGKADAEHDHPHLAEEAADAATRAAEAAERAEETADDLADLEERVDDLDAAVSDLEERAAEAESRASTAAEESEAAAETAADLTEKTTRLARALVALRDRVRDIARTAEERSAVDDLRRRANREGLRVAACEACDGRVDVGLLTEPACPHCGAPFSGVEPKRGLFGSNTLQTGDPPALEAGDEEATDEALRELTRQGGVDD